MTSVPLRPAAFLLLALLSLGPARADDDSLAPWRWHARPLLLFAPSQSDPALLAQQRVLEADRAGLHDRDLILLTVLADQVSGFADPGEAARLRRRFGVPAGRFSVVLVGKDGGEKLRLARPVTLDRLYAVIDAMPMRRDEMNRRGGAP